jgi:hypothetical protein
VTAARLMTLLLVATLPAWGAPPPSSPPSTTMKEARELYQRGMTKYSVRNFEGAIADFKAAYELTREPGLLFDLGQASRLAKNPEEALYFYRTYLRQRPNAPNRRDVEAFVDQLSRQVPPSLPPPVAVTAPAPAPALFAPAPKPPRAPLVVQRRTSHGRVELGVGIGLLGVAVGALAGGVAVGVAARNHSDSVAASARSGVPWTADLRSEWDQGQRESAAATALYVIGGVAGAVGVTLTALGARKLHGRLAAGPAAGGAQVAWTSSF